METKQIAYVIKVTPEEMAMIGRVLENKASEMYADSIMGRNAFENPGETSKTLSRLSSLFQSPVALTSWFSQNN